MEVEYVLTRQEYQHTVYQITMSRPSTRATLLLMPVVGPILVVFFLATLGIPAHILLPVILSSLLIFLALIPFMHFMIRAQAGNLYDVQSKTPSWRETVVRLEPEYIFVKSAVLKMELRWEAVTRIAEDKKGFFFYISPIQSYFIPRRVFVNAAEAQQFWTLAQSYYQHARRAPASVTA